MKFMNAADVEALELCIFAVGKSAGLNITLKDAKDAVFLDGLNVFNDSDYALQVALNLGISFKIDKPGVIITKFNYYSEELKCVQGYKHSELSSMPAMEAVRRAITYSAAEIGKRILKDEHA